VILRGHPLGSDPRVVTTHFRALRPIRRIALSFRRSRSVLPRIPKNARTFRSSARPTTHRAEARWRALLRLRPLQGITRTARRRRAARRQPRRQLLPWSFASLRRLSTSESACELPSQDVPPTGFLTLSTGYSSPARPALFHAGNALGIPLFRGFPPPSARAARHHPDALLAFSPRIRLIPRMSTRGVSAALSEASETLLRTFRALLRRRIRHRNCTVRPILGRSPPELLPL
jgi:hypothetical protein